MAQILKAWWNLTENAERVMREGGTAEADVIVMEIDMALSVLDRDLGETDSVEKMEAMGEAKAALEEARFGLFFGVLHPEMCSRTDGVEVAA